MILTGNTDFLEHFKKARCIAVSYVFDEETKIPLELAFVCENKLHAELFLQELLRWVEESDGDAVAMDFQEKKDGGYDIAIYPEEKRFTERLLPSYFKDKVAPIIMIPKQYKVLDRCGSNYKFFKENYMKAENITIGYLIAKNGILREKSKDFFLKKEFYFHKEGELPQKYAGTLSDFEGNSTFSSAPLTQTKEEISELRLARMKEFLPLTFHKMSTEWLSALQLKLEENYESVLVKQAICNLTVFYRIKSLEKRSIPVSRLKQPIGILEYLCQTYESFDSVYPPDDFYTEEGIIQQILNDKNELNSFLEKK